MWPKWRLGWLRRPRNRKKSFRRRQKVCTRDTPHLHLTIHIIILAAKKQPTFQPKRKKLGFEKDLTDTSNKAVKVLRYQGKASHKGKRDHKKVRGAMISHIHSSFMALTREHRRVGPRARAAASRIDFGVFAFPHQKTTIAKHAVGACSAWIACRASSACACAGDEANICDSTRGPNGPVCARGSSAREGRGLKFTSQGG